MATESKDTKYAKPSSDLYRVWYKQQRRKQRKARQAPAEPE